MQQPTELCVKLASLTYAQIIENWPTISDRGLGTRVIWPAQSALGNKQPSNFSLTVTTDKKYQHWKANLSLDIENMFWGTISIGCA